MEPQMFVVTDLAKSNNMNNRHLGAHNASKPMVTRESVCQQVRKPETIGVIGCNFNVVVSTFFCSQMIIDMKLDENF